MKVYVVTSNTSSVPLAEIREANDRIEFTVDNTDGKLPAMAGGSFAKLKDYVSKSSNLRMESPTEPTAHLLRYLLDNGDVAEITTDGRTCLLNGKLLEEAEKNTLFAAIRSGELKVARKADLATPISVLPARKQREESFKLKQKNTYNPAIMKIAKQQADEIAKMQAQASVANDDMIEKMDLSDLDTEDDRAMTRTMLYYLKYGKFKGGVDA